MASYRRYHDEDERANRTILATLYREPYDAFVATELKRLVRPYGTDARLGKAHPAQCSSWRAERSLQDPSADWDTRFANRVHLFAGVRDGLGNAPFGEDAFDAPVTAQAGLVSVSDDAGAEGIDETEPLRYPMAQTQRYLGYLSLRPLRDRIEDTFHLHYTAVAMLIPPPYMLRPRFHIITTIVGSADGILPFRAAPFFNPASPRDRQSPLGHIAPCMHAALHAALMLKATLFQCRPISSVEMVTLLWQMDHHPHYPLPHRPQKQLSFYEWLKEGLSLDQALAVLQHPEVRGGGVLEYIVEHSYLQKRKKSVALEALRCLTDYIANGIPVLLEITPKKMPQRGHAILVIGMRLMADPDDVRWPIPDDTDPIIRRIDLKELPSKFVIHDASKGPYEVVSASHLLSRAYIPTTKTSEGGIRFLALMPIHTRIGVQNVRDYAQVRFYELLRSSTYEEYLTTQLGWSGKSAKFPPPSETGNPSECRFICRLMRSRQILHRYLHPSYDETGSEIAETPERASAKNAMKERLQFYQDDYSKQVRKTICGEKNETIEAIALHWWCVEIRTPTQMQPAGNNAAAYEAVVPPLVVYFWPVTMAPNTARQGPPMRIEYVKGDRAELIIRTRYAVSGDDAQSAVEDATAYGFDTWRPSDG